MVACLVGCGGSGPTPDEGVPPAAEVTRVDGSANDLTGTWLQLVTTSSESSAPFVGTVTTENRRLFVLEVTQTAADVEVRSTLCDMTVETSTAMATTVVPDAFIGAIGVREWRATLTDGVLHAPRTPNSIGLRDTLEDQALPITADDPRVFDADGDGHPGVTIEVTGLAGGEMYFVQRGWRELQSTSLDGARIEGVVRWDDERVVLDATSRSLRNARPAEPIDDPQRNRFIMLRVSDGTTCADATLGAFVDADV